MRLYHLAGCSNDPYLVERPLVCHLSRHYLGRYLNLSQLLSLLQHWQDNSRQ